MSDNEDSKHRASTSFSDSEVQALETIFCIVRKGGDARIVARQPPAVSAARKIQNMRQGIESAKLGRALTKGGVS